MLDVTDHKILTADGVSLAATVMTPQDRSPRAVVQFHAGTVIRKEFYFKFCNYIAEQGYVVVLFDYRGVSGSRPKSLRGYQASITDWGTIDATRILRWIQANYPDLPVHLLAHSMGGQLLGLMSNWNEFDKITVLTSFSGNWNYFISSYRRRLEWPSRLLFPILIQLYGYVPAYVGLGMDWPAGVAQQWREVSMRDMLMSDYMNEVLLQTYYNQVDKQITAFFFTDDHMATPATVDLYAQTYPHAIIESRLISPTTYGVEKIGHIGLFKEWTKGPLWDDVITTLQ